MNFNAPRKNYTGLALVAVLHLVAAGIAVQHSKIWITHGDPGVIDLLPPRLPPEPEPQPTDDFDIKPKDTAPTIRPPIIDDFPPPDTTVEPHDPPTSLTRGGGVSDAGGTGTGSGSGEGMAAHTPVKTAPVIDASNCSKPDYPKAALRNGDAGTVLLAFLIGKDGRVASAKVEQSSGFRELDRAALNGLSLCRFKPGTVDGVPYESWTRMQYVWSVDE